MKDFAIYTVARFGIFLAIWGLLVLVAFLIWDTIDPSVLLVTAVVGAVISLPVAARMLRGPRERLAQHLADRAARGRARFEEMRSKEDRDDDTGGPGGPPTDG